MTEFISPNVCIPFRTATPLTRDLGELATTMGFAEAFTAIAEERGVVFNISGTMPPAEQGIIVASDHNNRVEPLLVQAIMHHAKRPTGSHVFAMPTSSAGRIMQSSGPKGKNLILPVIPHKFSAESTPPGLRNVVRKKLYPCALAQPETTRRSINDNSFSRAQEVVTDGGAVTIFPAGVRAEAGHQPWYSGLGKLIQSLPPETHDTTQVAVMRADAFSVARFATSLLTRGALPPMSVGLHIHSLGTIQELFPVLPQDPTSISEQVKTRYQSAFLAS